MIKRLFIVVALFCIFSCTFSTLIIKGEGGIKLRQVDFSDLPGWKNDNHIKAVISLVRSCDRFSRLPDHKEIGNQIGNITVADFHDVCDIAEVIKGVNNIQARNFFENWFVPFEVSNKKSGVKGLFTGYYQPELRGSRFKDGNYKYPIYARPSDLGSKPYYSREEIENGALYNQDLELIYVDDEVDLFFMHIQGSGRVLLEDGTVVKLAFDGKNNRPYSSIGKYIIENNIINKNNISYFAIKNWLKTDPEARKIMNINESYIFFKKSINNDVIGAQGVPLMPQRSLAVDSGIIPFGFPVWVNAKLSKKPYQKLMISQDTGSAIKGTVRGDIFFGKGSGAEELAARMNSKGTYYIFLPVSAVDKFLLKLN